ncbi:hypothetical protein Q1695_002891 [Nippostrongylus brasiliensis]|nr:hypothetical protein Q1695_002891 [Nippostrongylus brasiliensis]
MLPVLLNLLLFTYCYPFSIADDHPFTGPSGPLRRDAPKYSRFTPFQDPSTFPEPVFGMGHGFPFSSDRTKSDEVIPEDHAARGLGKEPHSPETSRPRSGVPPSEFSAHKESHSAEKPPPHASNEEEYQRHREGKHMPTPKNSEEDDRPPFPPWKQFELPHEFLEHKNSRKDSHERSPPDARKGREESGEERKQERRTSSEEPENSREQQRSQKDDRKLGNGGGPMSASAGPNHSREMETRDRSPSESREVMRTSENKKGKLVGVDIQLLAGTNAKSRKLQLPGRFSPLSGPFVDEEYERRPSMDGHFPRRRIPHNGPERVVEDGRRHIRPNDIPYRRFGPFGAYFERPTKPPPPIGFPPPRPLWIRNRFDSRMRKPDSESRESHRPMNEFSDSHKQEADIQTHSRSPFPATSTTVSTTPHAEKRDDPSTPAEAPVNQPAPKVLEDKRQIEASKENSDKCGQRTRADNDDRVNKLIKRAVVTSVPVNTSVTSTFSPFTSENGSNVSVTNNDRRFRDLRQNSGLDCGDSSESQDSGNTTTIALTVTVTTHPSVSSVSDHVPETTTYQATPSISNNAPQLTTQRAFFVISGVKTESGTPVTPKIEDSLIPQNSQNRTS